jgi:hypothetical protein
MDGQQEKLPATRGTVYVILGVLVGHYFIFDCEEHVHLMTQVVKELHTCRSLASKPVL